MPLFYQHTINNSAKIGVWHIAEPENFFLRKVPLQRDITHWHKRLQHLAGRYLLQQLYPNFPHHLIEIADTRKPFLTNEEYHFSISHCGDYAAVIISKEKRVGIDIELITPKVEKIKHKFLNEEELLLIDNGQLTLRNGPSTNKAVGQLTLLWCCKEAIFKWDGAGGIDFRRDINLASSDPLNNIIDGEFLKENRISLQINYHLFDGMCLAWIIR